MARLVTYQDDLALTDTDKVIGSNEMGQTRQFPLSRLREYVITGTSVQDLEELEEGGFLITDDDGNILDSEVRQETVTVTNASVKARERNYYYEGTGAGIISYIEFVGYRDNWNLDSFEGDFWLSTEIPGGGYIQGLASDVMNEDGERVVTFTTTVVDSTNANDGIVQDERKLLTDLTFESLEREVILIDGDLDIGGELTIYDDEGNPISVNDAVEQVDDGGVRADTEVAEQDPSDVGTPLDYPAENFDFIIVNASNGTVNVVLPETDLQEGDWVKVLNHTPTSVLLYDVNIQTGLLNIEGREGTTGNIMTLPKSAPSSFQFVYTEKLGNAGVWVVYGI